MAINFEEIPSVIEIATEPSPRTRTVLEELNARQYLLNERTTKCNDIKAFYEEVGNKAQHRYIYKYLCICPRYKPKYVCKHTDNIVIDRDIWTREEHIVHLATPKINFAAPRPMPRYIVKKCIIANCTPRIIHLAKPDKKQVSATLYNFGTVISTRQKKCLEKLLQEPPQVEYTSITNALDLLIEEKRLKSVAKRNEKLLCEKLKRKSARNERREIKRIVDVLFEQMKDFLLSDKFVMDKESTLVQVILKALRDFTDKKINMTNILCEYQKTLAINLAVWINQFISSYNINDNENIPQPLEKMPDIGKERCFQDLKTFLPVDDSISSSDEDENYNHYYQVKTS